MFMIAVGIESIEGQVELSDLRECNWSRETERERISQKSEWKDGRERE